MPVPQIKSLYLISKWLMYTVLKVNSSLELKSHKNMFTLIKTAREEQETKQGK
jgi:hypothetical protein